MDSAPTPKSAAAGNQSDQKTAGSGQPQRQPQTVGSQSKKKERLLLKTAKVRPPSPLFFFFVTTRYMVEADIWVIDV